MTTSDTTTLVALTALFAVFTAAMAWAEMLTRRHIVARASVDTLKNARDALSNDLNFNLAGTAER